MPTDRSVEDYQELGFRCGIEIHQQLDTDEKLFCSCETDPENDAAVAAVRRELRPVPSEIGEVDRAAQFEYLQDKAFTYNIYDDTSCLVELDEEPPHPLNDEALDTALTAARLMDCTVPDEIHVMRKTVIDGSNTAGFQRTAVVGLDGSIETEHGTVAIEDIELEEDSAGIHERDDDSAVYDLDRLGIPLIEVGTDASIVSPGHAKQVAERIGMLLRSTRRVKRGLGTIRQDVNVSIDGGARVEIKGFQNLQQLDTLVANEVDRQHALVQLQDELDGDVAGDVHDVTDLFADADNRIIQRVIDSDGRVVAFTLHGLEGYMNEELCDGLTLGKELANYATAHGVRGMMHTDEDVSRYDLADAFSRLADDLDKEEGDVIAVIAAREGVAEAAARAVLDRAANLGSTVPEETRTADGATTRYARPLPGEARMYPETDIPPIRMTAEDVAAIDEALPLPLDEKEEALADAVGPELASQLVDSPRLAVYDRVVAEHDVDPPTVANVLTNVLGSLASREDLPVEDLSDERLEAVIATYADGTVPKGQLEDLLRDAVTEDAPVDELAQRYEGADEDDIRTVVEEVIAEKQDLIEEQGEHARGALMGVIMQRLDNADGAAVNRILDEALQDALS